MARIVSVVISDDLDRSPGAQAVAFGFGGRSYEIGLGKKDRARFQKSLQPFMDAGRGVTQRRTAKGSRDTGPGTGRAAVRAWAAGQGLQVSERGRIGAEVMSRYDLLIQAIRVPREPVPPQRSLICRPEPRQTPTQRLESTASRLPSMSRGWLFPACECAPVLAAVKQTALDGGCGPA
jgi:hypothetical protein